MLAVIDNNTRMHDAQNVKLADNDKDALILIRAEPSKVPYILHVTQFDEQKQTLTLGSFAADTLIKVDPSSDSAYLAKKVEPGTYVYSFLADQVGWAGCFQASTLKFTVHAGEAVFLGTFRPAANLQQINDLTVASGQLSRSISSGVQFYYDNILPPQISTPNSTSADFAAAKNYEASSLPSLRGRLQPAVYQPARFELGKNLVGKAGCVN